MSTVSYMNTFIHRHALHRCPGAAVDLPACDFMLCMADCDVAEPISKPSNSKVVQHSQLL
jgi:hypothetical protein